MNKKLLLVLILGLAVLGAYFIYGIFYHMNNQVLQSFEVLNERLEESNAAIIGQNRDINEELLQSLDLESQRKITQIDSVSQDLFMVIDKLRNKIIPNLDDVQDYSKYDTVTDENSLLFRNNSAEGEQLVLAIAAYRDGISDILGSDYPKTTALLNTYFNTDSILSNGQQVSWLAYHFKDFPIIAVVIKLTQMQADIVNLKQTVFNEMVLSNVD